MSTWDNQEKSTSTSGRFKLKIDDTHFLKIDVTHDLLIEDGSSANTWDNLEKS